MTDRIKFLGSPVVNLLGAFRCPAMFDFLLCLSVIFKGTHTNTHAHFNFTFQLIQLPMPIEADASGCSFRSPVLIVVRPILANQAPPPDALVEET